MGISVKQKIVSVITNLWFLSLLVLGPNISADEKYPKDINKQPAGKLESSSKDVNDLNELWWSRWDALINDPNDPNEMLETKWNSVVTVLQNKEMDQNLKKKIIDKIMSPIFDSELMAKLALGRTHWPKLTTPQQKRFTELFAELLKSLYLEKTTLYKNEKALFKSAEQKIDTVQISMVLISSGEESKILYKLRKMDKAKGRKMNEYWKIYDVEIEGVSILLTYRSQFDDILLRGSIDDLLSKLEKPPAK